MQASADTPSEPVLAPGAPQDSESAVFRRPVGAGTLDSGVQHQLIGSSILVDAGSPGRGWLVLPNQNDGYDRLRLQRVTHLWEELSRRSRHLLRVYEADSHGAVCDLWTIGSVKDLPALRWGLARKLELIRAVGEALEVLHAAGLVHGALTPDNVLLDDELQAVVAEAGLLDPSWTTSHPRLAAAFAAPEVRHGHPAGVSADVYALGRLLQFVLVGEVPKATTESTPRLAELDRVPAGLVRIIRRCSLLEPTKRYQSVTDLLRDLAHYGEIDRVGIGHRDFVESNLSGVMVSGQPPRRRPLGSAKKPSRRLLALAVGCGFMALVWVLLSAL